MTVRYRMHRKNIFAPTCAYDLCLCKVGFHKKTIRADGTPGYKWKTFCEEHRTTKKYQVDRMKMTRKCENTGQYGFECTSTIIDPCQIDVHHKDGNHMNNAPANKECLCKNCHAIVTKLAGHHTNTYKNAVSLPEALFELPETMFQTLFE